MASASPTGRGAASRWLVAAALAAGTVALYARVANHPFIFFDDVGYVTDNRMVQDGLTWHGLRWAFTTLKLSNWHPLTWLSHMLDVQLFGLDPGWHHLVNAALHGVDAALLFLVLARMTGANGRSAFVAALFAVHPLHVESVAWVAERKDVLSTLFGFLALAAYVHHARRPSTSRLAVVTLCFALSLLAKPMWVTLPFLLLLLDVWPLGRVPGWPGEAGAAVERGVASSPIRQLILEKLPLLALSAASCVMTVVAQNRGGAMTGLELGLGPRVANTVVAYARYLGKTFWPDPLAIYYPHPGDGLPWWEALGAAVLLFAITAIAVWMVRRRPWLAIGWFWFLGTLVPVIGLVQVGSQAIADRYTYLPIVGLFIAIAWEAVALAGDRGRIALPAAAVIVVLALVPVTWRYLGYWSDHISLFEHALAVEPGSGIAHGTLSEGLRHAGRLDEAVAHAREAVRLDPRSPRHWNNLAMMLREQHRLGEARDALWQSLHADETHVSAWSNLGLVEQELGNLEEAGQALTRAAQLAPDDPQVRYRLGQVRERRGDVDGAIASYREAVRLRPDYGAAWNAVAVLYQVTGRVTEAGDAFRAFAQSQPDDPIAWRNLGVYLTKRGELPEAARSFSEALRLKPGDPDLLHRLAVVQAAMGQRAEALELARRLDTVDPARAADVRAKVGEGR